MFEFKMKERHLPEFKKGRCCWICGRMGGSGFTFALRRAGYNVPPQQIAYAHTDCMQRIQNDLRPMPEK